MEVFSFPSLCRCLNFCSIVTLGNTDNSVKTVYEFQISLKNAKRKGKEEQNWYRKVGSFSKISLHLEVKLESLGFKKWCLRKKTWKCQNIGFY